MDVFETPMQNENAEITCEHIEDIIRKIEEALISSSETEKSVSKKSKAKPVYVIISLIIILSAGCLCALINPWISVFVSAVLGALLIFLKDRFTKETIKTSTFKLNHSEFTALADTITAPVKSAISKQSKELKEALQTIQADKEEIEKLNQMLAASKTSYSESESKISAYEKKLKELASRLAESQANKSEPTPPSAESTAPAENTSQSVDLSEYKTLANWLQAFAIFANRSNNQDIRRLYNQLKSDLRTTGVYIYDNLEYDNDGEIKLPNKEFFVDWRSGDEWTEVMLPVIYTKDKVLVTGQIK